MAFFELIDEAAGGCARGRLIGAFMTLWSAHLTLG
jgi:hypothetical protein